MTPDPITTAREALDNLIAARKDFVAKRASMNAARPALEATRAERDLYDERYKADHAAERELWTQAISFATLAADLDLAAQLEKLKAERDAARETAEHFQTQSVTNAEKAIRLTSQLEQAEKAIERLGSSEALTTSFYRQDNAEGLELVARIDFAREALKDHQAKKERENPQWSPEVLKHMQDNPVPAMEIPRLPPLTPSQKAD